MPPNVVLVSFLVSRLMGSPPLSSILSTSLTPTPDQLAPLLLRGSLLTFTPTKPGLVRYHFSFDYIYIYVNIYKDRLQYNEDKTSKILAHN